MKDPTAPDPAASSSTSGAARASAADFTLTPTASSASTAGDPPPAPQGAANPAPKKSDDDEGTKKQAAPIADAEKKKEDAEENGKKVGDKGPRLRTTDDADVTVAPAPQAPPDAGGQALGEQKGAGEKDAVAPTTADDNGKEDEDDEDAFLPNTGDVFVWPAVQGSTGGGAAARAHADGEEEEKKDDDIADGEEEEKKDDDIADAGNPTALVNGEGGGAKVPAKSEREKELEGLVERLERELENNKGLHTDNESLTNKVKMLEETNGEQKLEIERLGKTTGEQELEIARLGKTNGKQKSVIEQLEKTVFDSSKALERATNAANALPCVKAMAIGDILSEVIQATKTLAHPDEVLKKVVEACRSSFEQVPAGSDKDKQHLERVKRLLESAATEVAKLANQHHPDAAGLALVAAAAPVAAAPRRLELVKCDVFAAFGQLFLSVTTLTGLEGHAVELATMLKDHMDVVRSAGNPAIDMDMSLSSLAKACDSNKRLDVLGLDGFGTQLGAIKDAAIDAVVEFERGQQLESDTHRAFVWKKCQRNYAKMPSDFLASFKSSLSSVASVVAVIRACRVEKVRPVLEKLAGGRGDTATVAEKWLDWLDREGFGDITWAEAYDKILITFLMGPNTSLEDRLDARKLAAIMKDHIPGLVESFQLVGGSSLTRTYSDDDLEALVPAYDDESISYWVHDRARRKRSIQVLMVPLLAPLSSGTLANRLRTDRDSSEDDDDDDLPSEEELRSIPSALVRSPLSVHDKGDVGKFLFDEGLVSGTIEEGSKKGTATVELVEKILRKDSADGGTKKAGEGLVYEILEHLDKATKNLGDTLLFVNSNTVKASTIINLSSDEE